MTDSEKIKELQAKIEILLTQNKGLEIAFGRLVITADDLELSNKNLKAMLTKELTDHEAFTKNMKNVLEIEKRNAVKEAMEKLIGHLADLFDCPCNYSIVDNDVGEYMGEYCDNTYGDDCTCDVKECWRRVLNRWVSEE
nr:MAG TPA: hypothetical protein [Caudoviricetes sp.]